MKTTRCLVSIAALLVGCPGMVNGAGFEISEQSARAAGTANAGTAREGDPSAAWYNPAALVDGAGLRIGLGATMALPQLYARATDHSWSGKSQSSVSVPPHFYASYARGDFAAGLAANVPFGGNVRWPADWAGRFEVVASRPQFFRLSPFVGFRFGPLRLAAGPQVDIGSLEIRRNLDFIDTEGNVRVLVRGHGLGGHASLFWDVAEWLKVGLSYKSRVRLPLSGGADFQAPLSFVTRTPDQNARTQMNLPDKLTLGLASGFGQVRAFSDLGWTFWTVHRETVIDFDRENTPDTVLTHRWKSSLSARGGVEWDVRPSWMLRAGLYFEQTPVPAERLAPSSPDSDRLGLTCGGSLPLGRVWSLDLFYEYMALLSRTSASRDALLAAYHGHAHFLGLGLRYQGLTPG